MKKALFWSSFTVLFGLSCFYTLKLFLNLNPGFESLLSPNNPVVLHNKIVNSKFPYSDFHFVFASSPTKEKTVAFADAFLKKMRSNPSAQVRFAIHDLSKEISFFKDNETLFISPARWKLLRNKIKDIKENKELFFLDDGKLVFRPSQIESTEREKASKMALTLRSLFSDVWSLPFRRLGALPEGRLLSHDGAQAGIYIVHDGLIATAKEAQKFENYITQIYEQTKKSGDFADVDVERSGISQTLLKEYESLWESLWMSLGGTLAVVFWLLFYFYRNAKVVLSLSVFLGFSTVLTFAVSYFLFRQLNANTLYLCVVIVGNGINPGIIYMSKLFEASRRLPLRSAVNEAKRLAFRPTLIASLASAVAYGALAMSSLKGYSEFGYIGFIGTLFAWGCALGLIPIFMQTRLFSPGPEYLSNFAAPKLFRLGRSEWLVSSRTKLLAVFVSLIALIGPIYGVVSGYEFLSGDLGDLKSKNLKKYGLEAHETSLNRLSLSKDLLPAMTIYSEKPENLSFVYRDMVFDKNLEAWLNGFRVFHLGSLLPQNQGEALSELRKLNQVKDLASFIEHYKISRSEEELITKALENKDKKPLKPSDYPPRILDFFRGRDGKAGSVLYISFDTAKAEENLFAIGSAARRIVEIAGKREGVFVGGAMSLIGEVYRIMQAEAWILAAIAFFMVIGVFAIFYRKNKRRFVQMSCGFALTMLLFISLFPLLGLQISLLSFMAIPLSFGIGVDYSVNLVDTEGLFDVSLLSQRMTDVFPHIFLAALTTIASYIGMVFNGGQMALTNFGLLCLLGEFVTIFGALFILPSILTRSKKAV